MPFDPGDRFAIRGTLGEGAMGIVYRAWDRREGAEVALKTVHDFDPDSALFLRREFRALKNIRHPSLVRLYELFASAQQCFFTMELVHGADVITAVRGDAPPGELPGRPLGEVVDLFLQIADGLAAVHAAERLHRDVKPTNVLVSTTGRAVLLDFGLAHVFSPGTPVNAEDDGMSGTPGYVSPEQAWGLGVGPSTDWYSFGAILFEALSGRRAFDEENVGRLLLALRQRDAPPLDDCVAGVPAELVALVGALLARDPEARPGHAQVAEVLGRFAPAARAPRAPPPTRLPFIGRTAQLQRLHAAFEGVREGEGSLLYVSGPSGMGKSELVRRFLTHAEREAGAVVLQGRCQPLETVPFKAFDALVDELSVYLRRQPDETVEELLPAEPAALLRIFPVLSRVPVLDAYRDAPQPIEPHELRRWGARALRELLARLAARVPLVLHIDDFQWGDIDSVGLLADVLRVPDAPSVLVLLTHRSEDTDSSPALRALAQAMREQRTVPVARVEVGPFGAGEMAEIGERLRAGGLGVEAVEVDALVAQAAGSPFFLGELVRWRRALGGGARGELSVADVIRARVAQLSPAERDLLDTVALAGRPLDPHLALRAAGVVEGGAEVLYALDETFLRRVASGEHDDVVEPLHDRIREVVEAGLDPGRRVALHLALAGELRRLPEADPLQLMEHYRKAGDAGEAAFFGEQAARHAEDTLAFDLAADLYRLVIELRGGAADHALRTRLAHALKNAGRGAEAAERFVEAAAAGEAAGADPAWVRLQRQAAAEQFLHNGLIDRGMELLGEGLERVGHRLPASPWRGLLRATWYRVGLAWRGLRFTPRDPAGFDPDVVARLDTLWGATTALSMFSHSRADPLGVAHLRMALEAGDARRVRRALRYEAAFEVGLGGGLAGRIMRATGVLDAVDALPPGEDEPWDRAWSHLCAACVAWFRADWRECARAGREGERIFRTECRGAHWEISVINLFMLAALTFLGETEELDHRVREGLRDATRRGDRFAATIYRLGEPLSVWLYADEPDEAERLAEEAIAGWPSRDFDTQHYHHVLAVAHVALYRGDPWRAWAELEARWPALRRSLLLEYRAVYTELVHLRARVALACAAVDPPATHARWTRARLLRAAARDARRIAAVTELRWSAPLAASIDGAVAALEGRSGEARRQLRGAAEGFEALGMRLFALAAWHRLGLLGGPPPQNADGSLAPTPAEVEARMVAMGVKAPERVLGLLAPWSAAPVPALADPSLPPRLTGPALAEGAAALSGVSGLGG